MILLFGQSQVKHVRLTRDAIMRGFVSLSTTCLDLKFDVEMSVGLMKFLTEKNKL